MKAKKIILLICGFLPLIILTCCKTGTENPPANCEWQTVFFDDFTRADGPIGANYTVQVNSGTGTPVVNGNILQFNGPADYWAIRYVNAVTGNTQRVSMKFIGKKNFAVGVATKSRDLGSNWLNQEFYAAFVNDTAIGLQKCQGMIPAVLASGPVSITVGHQYLVIITVDGAALSASIEDLTAGGKTVVSATDTGTLNTGTTASMNGCCLSPDDFILMDDFTVEVCK